MQPDIPAPLFQASAVPYRLSENGAEFCLITSLSSGRWGFPKGLIDPGETPTETALKEALEEADPLGDYQYAKWGTTLSVTVFLMEVHHCDATWLEADRRQRQWATAKEAGDMLDRRYLARLLRLAVKRLGGAG
jgi:8-oxo-dGTP pyrophosphatase MutT (NUDIX family)